MAWLFKKSGSPYWYLGYKKSTGKPAESLRLRWDDPAQTREARDRLREANADEKFVKGDEQRFTKWVPALLQLRYSGNAENLKAYTNRWRTLETFLTSRRILYPKDVTGQTAWDFLMWRTGPQKREGGVRRAKKNTALEDLKAFRMLMRHAVAVGYASRNAIADVRIPWDDPKQKQEIEPDHLLVITKALKQKPLWMRTMFAIGFYTGCRLNDSRLLLKHVDLDRKLLHFPEPKGKKPFTIPIPPPLLPLLTQIKASGAKFAFDPGRPMRNTAMTWIHFFRSLQMPYSYHSLRCSFISRCIRAGIQETVTLRLVNHSSVLVNRLYQKFRGEDLRSAVDSMSFPSLETPETPGEPPAKPELPPGQGSEHQASPSPPSPSEDTPR